MLRKLLFISILFIVNVSLLAQEGESSLDLIAQYMQGEFNSEEQSKSDSTFLNITFESTRIWDKSDDGIWLYVEQAFAFNKQKPYRQRVYHITSNSDGAFTCSILKIPEASKYIGAYHNPKLLDVLAKESLTNMDGCEVILKQNGACFEGSTNGKSCASKRAGTVYATSELKICKNKIVAWDRGWDANDTQTWGSAIGGYVFKRIK
jgi:hypothetical protein